VACTKEDPLLGLIFPVDRPIPEEGLAMYKTGVRFTTSNLDLKTMTPEGYDAVLDDIPPAARKLKEAGAQAIVLMGTSLTFYKGAAFNKRLMETVAEASGLPATTMSNGVIEGLREVKGKRLAVATAYNDEVNERLRVFLGESGFEVLALKGLGIEAVAGVDDVTQDQLLNFGAEVFQSAPEADAMLVSCGGFRTLEIIAPLEERTKVPVISSTPHTLWAGVRLLGLSGSSPGYGTLLDRAA
jgi:arylmalonate decarboxylase